MYVCMYVCIYVQIRTLGNIMLLQKFFMNLNVCMNVCMYVCAKLIAVDLPGVGYAQASRNLRSNWTNLLRSFSHERPTLRILFHLIDSRHGNVCIFMYVCMYVCNVL